MGNSESAYFTVVFYGFEMLDVLLGLDFFQYLQVRYIANENNAIETTINKMPVIINELFKFPVSFLLLI